MKIKWIIFSLFLITFFAGDSAKAQLQFQWATAMPWNDAGQGTENFSGDSQGNIIYVSIYTDTFTFNSVYHSAAGTDLVLAKLNNTGEIQWVKTFGGPANENVSSTCTDSHGNIYITGSQTGDIYIDNDTIFKTGALSNFYLAKFDPQGNILWAKTSNGYQGGGALAKCDNSDNVIVIGGVSGSIQFDSTSLSFINGTDGGTFVAQFDSNGVFKWLNGAKNIYLMDFGLTSQNEIILYGSLSVATVTYWGNNNQVTTTFHGLGNNSSDAITLKLNSSGNLIWNFLEGGTDDMYGYKILVYNDGKYAVSGSFYGTATIAGQSATVTSPYSTFYCAFYDSAHAGIWLKIVEVDPISVQESIEIYKAGDYILTNLKYASSPGITCQYSGFTFPESSGAYYTINLGSCDASGIYTPFIRDSMLVNSCYYNYGFYTSVTNVTYMTGEVINNYIFNSGDTVININGYYHRFIARLGNNFSTSTGSLSKETVSINVYPNPSTDCVYIHSIFPGKYTAAIYNLTGENILETTIQNDDVLKLPERSGIYILKISGDNVIVNRKIIKL